MLEENSFVYHTRVKVEVDKDDESIGRELIQIFFAHRKQLEAAQRFVADWLIVIDGTFNTNKLDLPLLVIVGVLSTVIPAKAYHTVVAHDAIPSHHSSLLVFWPRL
jgi:hypothetical protein